MEILDEFQESGEWKRDNYHNEMNLWGWSLEKSYLCMFYGAHVMCYVVNGGNKEKVVVRARARESQAMETIINE